MKLKKILALACCAVLLVCISVGATLAYLTDDDAVTNTFTVGKVEITLDEADVDDSTEGEDRDQANEYKLIPGGEYEKDPTVHVAAGSEEAWLFVKVVNGIADVEAEGETTIEAQMIANGWTAVEGADGYYSYKETVSAGEDIVVFSTFSIAEDVKQAALEACENIEITAYAIQAADLDTVEEAWTALGLN